jgi:hypothetical protein
VLQEQTAVTAVEGHQLRLKILGPHQRPQETNLRSNERPNHPINIC